jgi:hypothetical protein
LLHNLSTHSYETVRSPTEPTAEALYDVPRSNRRVSLATAAATTAANKQQLLEKQLATEAIYVNDNFVVSEKEEGDCTYDVPAARSEDLILIGQSLSQSFDVPRTRDSLSTIEEEHQVSTSAKIQTRKKI